MIQYEQLFFPDAGRTVKKAKEFCKGCPVRDECLEFALKTESRGIWAGTTFVERQAILKFKNGILTPPVSKLKKKVSKSRRTFTFN